MKSKLTPTVIENITAALRAGNYIETACQYAGISAATYYRWLTEADQPDATDLHRDLREAVEKARADAEVRNVQLIQQAAQGGTWQAAAWWLERSHPKKWGRQQKVELSGENGGPIDINVNARKHVMELLGLEE